MLSGTSYPSLCAAGVSPGLTSRYRDLTLWQELGQLGHREMSTLVLLKPARSWVLAPGSQHHLADATHPQHVHSLPTAAMATGKTNFLHAPVRGKQ